ncbi:melanoregulin [Ambystoma mexicanum]|uniref:melanoregulin n=1 Tax=Ambystoma mexicanum TaxID=8296 RepID=UPI0037E77F44
MGLKEMCCAFGCCCFNDVVHEKAPLVGNNSPYPSYTLGGGALRVDDDKNLWSSPGDLSHMEADDDRVLQNFIETRKQLEKDSEDWQKLNYDIYALRQARREVRNRWKRILEDLGFQKEAETLLSVTKLSTISDSQNMKKAKEMLQRVTSETDIVPAVWGLPNRYLFVMDRLIALDAVEDFFQLALRKYPKSQCDSCPEDLSQDPPEYHSLPQDCERNP